MAGADLRAFTPHTITIGAYCSIADNVVIMAGAEHDPSRVSTFAFGERLGCQANPCSGGGDTVIGNDVWLGRGVTVLSGVTIGDGAVIGAGAVVADDIAPYAVAVGVPARVKRFRFDEDTIARLLALKWWEWPDRKVRQFAPLLSSTDVHAFLEAACG
jgi:acetyltransferase-like isoleucine patch superfamily enzyme